ncbi:MAG: DNA alkylation repair protein [Lautropia sp.]|nr:DNA alkylation repair protein [Lautropia sp.]
METENELFGQILGVLEAQQNPADAAAMRAYMQNQFSFLGVRTPERRRIARDCFRKTDARHLDWSFIDQCWQSPWREMQYVALDYLQLRAGLLSPADVPRLKTLVTRKSWWDTIDNLDRIIGGIALRHPEVGQTLLAWSTDENIWLRRVAIDHQLLRKKNTNTELLGRILVNNLGRQEFFINKAIGWALRDYSKTDPAWVRAFIDTHRQDMAALSLREASKYL